MTDQIIRSVKHLAKQRESLQSAVNQLQAEKQDFYLQSERLSTRTLSK